MEEELKEIQLQKCMLCKNRERAGYKEKKRKKRAFHMKEKCAHACN